MMDWTRIGLAVASVVAVPAMRAQLKLNSTIKTHIATDELQFQQIHDSLSEIKDSQKDTNHKLDRLIERAK
jgi:hypothetical protein